MTVILAALAMLIKPIRNKLLGLDKLTDALLQRVDEGEIILPSSPAGSTKKFKLTVDDTGAVSATEVTT